MHSAALWSFLSTLVSAIAAAQAAPETPSPATPSPPDLPAVAPPAPPAELPASSTAAPSVPEPVPATAKADPAPPLAGWYGGLFYLRDSNDDFRLYLQGRAQIDMYNYFGPGVGDTGLKSTVFLRRIRPELTGEIRHVWQFMLAGDFGQTSVDNARGNAVTAVGPPVRFASAQTSAVRAAPTDVFINFHPAGIFNLQFGQYDAPFTMENRTSDKYIPFMERSMAVRALGIPSNKEIGLMAWGETSDKSLFYSVGVFDGDSQNRPDVDNRADVMGRVFVHPLASAGGAVKDLQIGGSFRYGMRDSTVVLYDYTPMTTQGNYTFWSPNYTGSNGPAHVIPSGAQAGVAGELRIPVSDCDFTGELVYVKNNTREGMEGTPQTTFRRGDLAGYSYYAQIGYWPLGHRDISGLPGYENPSHVDFEKPAKAPEDAVQLLLKWEQLKTSYHSASRAGSPDAKGIDGDTKINAFSFGVNYFATKHLRMSLNYVVNMFPDSKATPSPDQRAQAPGNTLGKGINDQARDHAHLLHEVLLRAAVAL